MISLFFPLLHTLFTARVAIFHLLASSLHLLLYSSLLLPPLLSLIPLFFSCLPLHAFISIPLALLMLQLQWCTMNSSAGGITV